MASLYTPRNNSISGGSSFYQTPRGRKLSRSNSGMSLASLASFTTDSIRELQDDGVLAKVKRLDFYGGPRAEFRKGTMHGALMSLIAIILAIFLISRELQYSLSVRTSTTLQVDSQFDPFGRRTNFTFSLQFPNIACRDVSVSAEDNNGNPQLNVEHHITRLRLDSRNRVVGTAEKHTVGNTVKDEVSLLGNTGLQIAKQQIDTAAKAKYREIAYGGITATCGDCFGAGEPDECCNTCDDVKDKYRRLGWSFDPSEIPQCEESSENLNSGTKSVSNKPIRAQEGCYLTGYLELSKARGNIHFAPSSNPPPRVQDAADYLQHTFESFNTTHSIGILRFGEAVPGIVYPLEGKSRKIRDSYGMYSYYVKIVPTTYVPLTGDAVTTNQYSVTEHLKHVEPGSGRGLPGVYFYYEVSTVTARIEEFKLGYLKFFTSVCAVVGGLYTVLGIVDHIIGSVHR